MSKNIHNKRNIAVGMIMVTLAVIFIYTSYSYPDGITGRTSTSSAGCGSCHGTGPSSQVSASVVSGSGSFTVAPNSTTTFTVTVSTTNLAKVSAGINLAVKTDQNGNPGTSIGTLTAGTGLRLANSELTHTAPKNLSGGATSWTFTWTAPAATGTYYMRVLGLTANGNGGNDTADTWNWMMVQSIIVAESATITLTSPNGGEDLCAGFSHNVTWNSAGINQVRIELSSDGGTTFPTLLVDNYSASPGNWSWPVPANQQAGSNYKIRILDASNYNIKDVSNAVFNIHAKTAITSHPAPLELCLGSTAVFSVTATGENLQYYWRKNGNYIPNANTNSLYLNNITYSDSASYSCVVVGLCDSVSSTAAKLSIKAPPTIVTQPKGDTVCIGSPATVRIEATGVALNYSWSKNGITIPGSNTSELVFTNVVKADSGSYECVISGACLPKVTSLPAQLVVYTPVTITQMPANKAAMIGDTAYLELKATGTDLKYQWRKNKINIPGKQSPVLDLYNVTQADSGSYDCIVSNRCGQVTSRTATLTITKPDDPVIELTTTNVDFGTVSVGNIKDTLLTGVIKNKSNVDLIINSIQISGPDAQDYNMFGITLPVTIPPGDYRTLSIEFAPSSIGAKTATVNFTTNAKNVVSISLIGYGVAQADVLICNSWDFGQVLIGTNKTSKNFIVNIGTEKVDIQKPIVNGYDSLNFQLLDEEKYPVSLNPGDSIEANFMFVPTVAKSYEVSVLVKNNSLNDLTFTLKGVGVTTDVSELTTENGVTVYPNPANDIVNIKFSEGIKVSFAEITNAIGITITKPSIEGDMIKWDLTSNAMKVSPGIYFIRIKTGTGIICKRLIIL